MAHFSFNKRLIPTQILFLIKKKENDERIMKDELIRLQLQLTFKSIYKLAEICIKTIALSRNFRLILGVCEFYGFLKEPSRSSKQMHHL